jgi:hypothetical protein
MNHHGIMTTLALVSLCLSLVINTTLCQYSLKLDSLTSLRNVLCPFLFLLKSCIFSCCLEFHCSTKCFSFFNFFTILYVRKIGPRSNKIKQMWKQNTKDTQYKRDIYLRGSPNVGYVHQRNCQVLPLLLSNK